MRRTAPTVPIPIPTFAPVPRPLSGCDVCVEVGDVVAVETIAAVLLVDVGLKSFVQVTEPPLDEGTVFTHAVSETPHGAILIGRYQNPPPSSQLLLCLCFQTKIIMYPHFFKNKNQPGL